MEQVWIDLAKDTRALLRDIPDDDIIRAIIAVGSVLEKMGKYELKDSLFEAFAFMLQID